MYDVDFHLKLEFRMRWGRIYRYIIQAHFHCRFTLSFNLHLLGALHSVSGLAIWFMGSGGQFNEQTEVLTVVWWYFLLAFTH